MFKKLYLGALVILIALAFTACNGDNGIPGTTAEVIPPATETPNAPESPAPPLARNPETGLSPWSDPESDLFIPDGQLSLLDGSIFEELLREPMVLLQLTPVQPGEELVVMHTNHGDITIRLFPDEAPLAVENFLTHARDGFYDGVTFHRVISGFMIQGGCPEGTGRGGDSIWGQPFGLEPSLNLRHFRGALAMAHAGGAMGSQFYFVQSTNIDGQTRELFNMMEFDGFIDMPIGRFIDGRRVYINDIHSLEEFNHFRTYGGTPFLDWHHNQNAHTVFGHVVEGMDVVDSIANTPRNIADRPEEDVIIEGFSFITY